MAVREVDEKDKTILALIRDSPGGFVGTKTVANELDMSTNGASYRLKQLEKDDRVKSKQLSRDKAWYLPEIEQTSDGTTGGSDGDDTTTRTGRAGLGADPRPIARGGAALLSRLANAVEIVALLALLSVAPALLGFISPGVTYTLATATTSGWLLHVVGALTLYAYEGYGKPAETPYHDDPMRIVRSN